MYTPPKKNINYDTLYRLYITEKKSIPEISIIINEPRSTVRNHLIYNKIPIRDLTSAVRNSAHKIGRKGIKKPHSELTKIRMKEARLKWGEKNAKGISLKPSGYYEITKGNNKGKMLHIIIMEEHIGRKLSKNEVVHHKNGVKTDNRIENLEIMTNSEHSRFHAKEREKLIKRNNRGQFINLNN